MPRILGAAARGERDPIRLYAVALSNGPWEPTNGGLLSRRPFRRQFTPDHNSDPPISVVVASGTTNNIGRYRGARGVVAFLLFLLPKPSDEAEQRQQMVPRAHSCASRRSRPGFRVYRLKPGRIP